MTVFETSLPADSFINGLEFPTVADLACFNITTGYMPFGAALKFAGYDTAFPKSPKFAALIAKCKAAGVTNTAFSDANPWGM